MTTYITYEHVYFYGDWFGKHDYYTTLKEAWQAYKEHKAYAMADSGTLYRTTMKKKLFGRPQKVNRVEIIGWEWKEKEA